MYGQLADIGLSAIRKITDLWSGAKADSLIDYTRVARVEPIVLIDNDCLYLESLPEVMQSLQSVFAGYYLQAIAISTNVGKVEVMRHLDKLNPNRKPLDSALDSAGWLLAQESYRHRLPRPNDARIALEASTTPVYKDADQIDADDRRVIDVVPFGEQFFDLLGPARCRLITHVSAGGADFIGTVVAEKCPNAVRVADPF